MRSIELSNAKRQKPLPGAPAVGVLSPAARHGGTPGRVLFRGDRRMQEVDGERKETMIDIGSARRKITVSYIQCGVDSILRPALGV